MNIASARHHRIEWFTKPPPKEARVLVVDAIERYGSEAKLAKALGISRSAVYQWRPPYRFDPFMPVAQARKYLWLEMREAGSSG